MLNVRSIHSILPLFAFVIPATVFVACVDDDATPPPADLDAGLGLETTPGADTGAPDSPAADAAAEAAVDAAVDAEPSCVAPTGAGTNHNSTINADETWTAAGSPHNVTFDISIAAGKTVTVEPCAEIRIDDKRFITVQGRLVAEGTAKRPIKVVPSDAAKKWGTIRGFAASEIRLKHVTLSGGGNVASSLPHLTAAIDATGEAAPAPQPLLFVDNVRIEDSAAMGVNLNNGAAFAPGSTGLVITGSGYRPMRTAFRSIGSLPAGTYTGNATDQIIIAGGDLHEDATIKNLGVPYHVGDPASGTFGRIRVATQGGQTNIPLLTIEPGVTLRFLKNLSTWSALLIGSNTAAAPSTGALVAVGTATAPITFTSADPAAVPGDWLGVYFSQIDPRSRIDHALVEYGGGFSGTLNFSCHPGDFGSILIIGGEPATQFVTNTTVKDTLGDGIGRGWQGTPLDFLPTNNFVNVARCKQSFPRPATGSCPAPPPCP